MRLLKISSSFYGTNPKHPASNYSSSNDIPFALCLYLLIRYVYRVNYLLMVGSRMQFYQMLKAEKCHELLVHGVFTLKDYFIGKHLTSPVIQIAINERLSNEVQRE